MLSEDGYTFGRFATVPLGKGSEALMQLDATPGGYIAFAAEAFVAGAPGASGKLTVKVYKDQKGKPGKVIATETATAKASPEGYTWMRARLGGKNEGLRLAALERVWVGVTSEDGDLYPALNPFSTTKRARFRQKGRAELEDAFNFKDQGKTPVSDYVIRLSGFGYVAGADRPEPLANDDDELVKRMKRADALADKDQFEKALAEYEAILSEMEKDGRRYESWIPVAVNSAGVMAYELKRYDVALERFQTSLRRAEAAKDEPNTADIFENLGETAFYGRKIDDARTFCDRSRALNEKLKRHDRLVENDYWIARADQEKGDAKSAEQHFAQALAHVKTAFAKDEKSEAEWSKRIEAARGGHPEDKPAVAERAETLNDESTKQKHKAKYRDLMQFLSDDTAED